MKNSTLSAGSIQHPFIYSSDVFVTFDNFSDELASSVAVVRERNNNSLTGHTVPSIINMVDKVLKEKSSKKQGNYVASYSVCLFVDLLEFQPVMLFA
jgi:hypothetical protein